MRSFGPLLLAPILLVAASCDGDTPDEVRADLCGDLGHLGPTIVLLVDPPVNVTIGELRGALEKLDPTVGDLEDSELVAEHLMQALLDARAGYRIALKPFGDDEPGSEAIDDAAGPAIDLGVTTTEVMDELACGQLTAES
jgi:hypothetical protein